MIIKLKYHTFYFLSVIVFVNAQDCRTYGQSCSDDYSCCGGCCLNGICKDTYLDCRTISAQDPCIDRYCSEDQVCVTSYPCTGCPLLTQCITMTIPLELKDNKTLTHHHRIKANLANCFSISYVSLSFCIISHIPLIFDINNY
ncbi:uncharacterized protein [Euwallacea similis]|uniref:uncharacterized protein n=1 Tax=Euwallacea similis TaxID=1736056 RepID=UPI00344BD0D4